jgi:glutamyl-tRNA(Gln) amidotransferase subunit D
MEKGKDAKPGDLIRIKTAKEEINGRMIESYEAGIVLIKLESGYNIGVNRDNILDIKVIKKVEDKSEKNESGEENEAKGKKGNEKKEGNKFELSHKKSIIDLIITGGTLSSSLDVKTGGVKFLTTPENLFKFYPDIFELADIRIINPFMTWSENMDSSHWLKIAKLVAKSLNDESVKGVIVTHGTDFLHYTSAALSFMLKNLNKPVALTYSQRSTDRASSDAELNLYCAAKYALSDIAEVALVGHANSDDDYCYALQGNKCRKMHSSRRDAFKPINTSPIAKVYKDRIEVLRDYNKRKTGKEMNGKKVECEDYFEDKVALIKFYPGQDPEILNYYFKQGYKGVVIEMTGLGHVLTEGARNWIPILKELIEKGFVVCAACQTIYGSLNPSVYEAGRRLEKTGVIYLRDMLSEAALVKLGWVLGMLKEKKIKKEQVKDIMLENIAGEFNERLGEEFIC